MWSLRICGITLNGFPMAVLGLFFFRFTFVSGGNSVLSQVIKGYPGLTALLTDACSVVTKGDWKTCEQQG